MPSCSKITITSYNSTAVFVTVPPKSFFSATSGVYLSGCICLHDPACRCRLQNDSEELLVNLLQCDASRQVGIQRSPSPSHIPHEACSKRNTSINMQCQYNSMPLRCITCHNWCEPGPLGNRSFSADQRTQNGPQGYEKMQGVITSWKHSSKSFNPFQPYICLFPSYWSREVSRHKVGLRSHWKRHIIAIQGANLSTGCLEFSPGASIGTVHIQDRTPSFQVALVNLKAE